MSKYHVVAVISDFQQQTIQLFRGSYQELSYSINSITHAALKKKISEISAKQKHCLGGLNTHVIYKLLIMQNINPIIHQSNIREGN